MFGEKFDVDVVDIDQEVVGVLVVVLGGRIASAFVVRTAFVGRVHHDRARDVHVPVLYSY